MMRKPKEYDDDNGMVVCDMNVEGTRWYNRNRNRSIREELVAARNEALGRQLTRAEARRYTWYSMLAGLLVVFVFSATWILFILFCTQIWFK